MRLYANSYGDVYRKFLYHYFEAFLSGTKCSLFWSFSGYGKRIFVNLVNRTFVTQDQDQTSE